MSDDTMDDLGWTFADGAYHSTRPLTGNEQLRALIQYSDGNRVELDDSGYATVHVPNIPSSAGRIYSGNY